MAPEALFRESLAMRRRLHPDGHPSIALDLHNLARLLAARGELTAAESTYRESVALYVRTKGPGHSLTGVTRLGLGTTLAASRRYAESETELVTAERILSTAQGVPAGRLELCYQAMVDLYGSWGGHPQAAEAAAAKLRALTEARAAAKPAA